MGNKLTRITVIVLAVVIIVLFLLALGYYFFLNPKLAHPAEDTSRFFPPNTRIYASVNLRPGVRQIRHAIRIMSVFKATDDDIKETEAAFPEQVEDRFDDFEDETGISIEQELFTWIGPEIAIGLVDSGEDLSLDSLEAVAFVGTTDPKSTEDFIDHVVDEYSSKDVIVIKKAIGDLVSYEVSFTDTSEELHLTITKEYLVLATTQNLLHDTLSMMDTPTNSLYDNPNFQKARQSVADPRFAMLYVDINRLIQDANKLQQNPDSDALEILEDQLPDFIGASASFTDMGIRVTGSWDTPSDQPVVKSNNQFRSSEILPSDTLALISVTGVLEGWFAAKDWADETLPDLSSFISDTGLSNGELNFDIDEILNEIEKETGIDVDDDIFSWMRAEVAFAVLSADIKTGSILDSVEETTVHALGIIELVDDFDQDNAKVGLRNIRNSLEEAGIDFDSRGIQGEHVTMADLQDNLGYEPGYLILEDQVLIGSTGSAFDQALSVRAKAVGSLSDYEEYRLVLKESSGTPNGLLYINVNKTVEAIVDGLSPSERADYQKNVASFVEPINTFSIVSAGGEQYTSVTVLLTFAEARIEEK